MDYKLKENQKKVISNCPLCEEKSLHIIGQDDTETQQCIHCGYATSSRFRLENDDPKSNEHYKSLTEELKDWSKVAINHLWIPSFITLPFGMLYPFNNDDNDMKWAVADMTDIPEEEQKNYPIPDQEGKFYTQKYDTDKALVFDKFVLAMYEINERAKKTNNTPDLPKLKINKDE